VVNILEGVPTFGQSFAKSFGAGIGAGIPKGVEFAHKMGVKNRADLKKNRAKILPAIKSHLSLFDRDKNFDAEKIGMLEERASQYIDKGVPANEAVSQAFQEMTKGGDQPEGKKSVFDQMQGTDNEENVNAPSYERNNIFNQMGVVNQDMKPSKGFMSNEKGEFSGEEFAKNIKRMPAMAGRAVTGLLDFPLQLGKKANYAGRGDFKTLTDYYDELTGGQGIPQNAIERVASGGVLGVPGVAAALVEEQLHKMDLPDWAQTAGGIATFILTHKAKNSKFGSIAKEAEKVAAETGKTAEEVIASATEEAKVNPESVAKGDESAIRSLKDKITEAPKISSKVSETPKTVFNKKAAQRERRIFGEKLAESPLDEYYSIKAKEAETQANKRPETMAREKEIRATLAPEEKKLFEDLRNKREDLARIDKARKKLVGQEKARVDTLYQHRVKSIEEATDKLKDVQYQMKYGRARPSEAEINTQIDSSVKRFKEGIENPTPENIKSLERQLELDKKYIERAAQLEKRGELSGEIRPDTFLRMKSKYLEGYKAAIKESKEAINALKQTDEPMAASAIAKEKQFIDTLQNRVKRLEADIVNQRDNIKAMRALEKPSGAFYKQQLKNLKRDDALFKNDLFKQNKLNSPDDLKVSKVYKENSPEVKLGKETAENPNPENLKKASEQTGKSEEAIKEDLKKGGEEFQKAAEQVNKGTLNPNLEAKIIKWVKGFIYSVGAGFASGAVLGLVDEVMGVKINSTIYRRLLSSAGFKSLGPITIGRDFVRSFFDDAQAKKLESLRSDFSAYNQYVAQMRKSYGESKVKRVQKILKEKRSQK